LCYYYNSRPYELVSAYYLSLASYDVARPENPEVFRKVRKCMEFSGEPGRQQRGVPTDSGRAYLKDVERCAPALQQG
jgi:hypothetical protein